MSIKAGDICNKNLITIQHEESLSVDIHKMRDHSISQLPVFDGLRRLVGILTEDNVAKIMIEHGDGDINLVKILSVMEPLPLWLMHPLLQKPLFLLFALQNA